MADEQGTSEAAALRWFLDAQRASVLAIVDGLDADQLASRILPSGWTPLGLIEHLGHAERYWFQQVASGSAAPLPWSEQPAVREGSASDGDSAFTTSRTASEVFAFYREQVERANAVLASTPLSTPPVERHDIDGLEDFTDLRSIVLHMIEETARHAGHLDVARELLDGRTGLGPR